MSNNTFNQQSAFYELAIGGRVTNKVWDRGDFVEFSDGVLVDQDGKVISPSVIFAKDGYIVFNGEKEDEK